VLKSSGFISLKDLCLENTKEGEKRLTIFSPSFSTKSLMCPKKFNAFKSQIFV
jgi:hypothetical protein